MKRILFLSFALVFCFQLKAQLIADHAIGIRFGDNDGFGGEVTYQRKLKENKRVEIDLGYRDNSNYDAFKLSGILQWVHNIDEGFNWYVGFGAGIGSWTNNNLDITNDKNGLFVNADGNIGIEYDFNIPLLISLDFRPEIGVLGDYDNDTDLDLALSLRYQF